MAGLTRAVKLEPLWTHAGVEMVLYDPGASVKTFSHSVYK